MRAMRSSRSPSGSSFFVGGVAGGAKAFYCCCDPLPCDEFVGAGGFIDGDLQVGEFAVDLVGGQHEKPAHEDGAFYYRCLCAVEAREWGVVFRVHGAHVEDGTLRVVLCDVIEGEFGVGQ
ncbi:hypothetical protein PCAR4_1000062 [Paraburkholderia caribensis]|nr:hypothetical protein PCAR4_1000062 [Paraburkholderia caribensis]